MGRVCKLGLLESGTRGGVGPLGRGVVCRGRGLKEKAGLKGGWDPERWRD